MSKIKRIIIIAITLGAVIVGYWLVSPLFIQKEVHEEVEDIQTETIRSGAFMGADSFHRASGTARLIKVAEKYYVRLEDDFTVTNGPDLFVHFGKNGAYAKEARLAPLKGNIGSQNYEVTEGIDPLQYDEIWIWCRAFSVPFGFAKLE